MNSEEKFTKVWEKEREKGKIKFVLKSSIKNSLIIIAGVILVRYLFITLIVKQPFSFKSEDFYILTTFSIVVLLASIIGTNLRWKDSETKYNAIKQIKD